MKTFTALAILLSSFTGIEKTSFKPDQSSWNVYADEDDAFVAYAVPESDVGDLWIYCSRPSGDITVLPVLFRKDLQVGDTARVILSSKDLSVSIVTRAARNRFGDINVSGPLPDPKILIPLFASRGTLKISLQGGNQVTLPLNRQARWAFAEFRNRCPSLR